jgi:tRNA threonylcarbamoyladenosine biosynthesis protein TsaE
MKDHSLIYSIDTLNDVSYEIYQLFPLCSVFTFTGSLGAGKTSLVQAILQQAGITDVVQSPTFAYISSYANAKGQTFYHFDLYRLKSMQDFIAAGFEEYLYVPNTWCLIEWPEIIMPMLNHRACHIAIDYHGDNRRRLRYSFTDEK